ncbi:hypothetical protein LSAT2_023644, partial [Lamellibrachia satsuma]
LKTSEISAVPPVPWQWTLVEFPSCPQQGHNQVLGCLFQQRCRSCPHCQDFSPVCLYGGHTEHYLDTTERRLGQCSWFHDKIKFKDKIYSIKSLIQTWAPNTTCIKHDTVKSM